MAAKLRQISGHWLLVLRLKGYLFFGSAESAGAGAAVGVLALLGAARFGCGGQAGARRAAPARLVTNERGVRLTMLGPQAEGGCGGAGAVGAVAQYTLMT